MKNNWIEKVNQGIQKRRTDAANKMEAILENLLSSDEVPYDTSGVKQDSPVQPLQEECSTDNSENHSGTQFQ